MTNLDKHVHFMLDFETFEKCRRLISFGVYQSMAELVRSGIDEVLQKEAGYEKEVEKEANERFSENDMNETRIKIDGTLMRLRVNSKWWHLNAKADLNSLIEDLHVPGPISALEEKYGTRIVLMTMHDDNPIV